MNDMKWLFLLHHFKRVARDQYFLRRVLWKAEIRLLLSCRHVIILLCHLRAVLKFPIKPKGQLRCYVTDIASEFYLQIAIKTAFLITCR
jgi:hypothetical protein